MNQRKAKLIRAVQGGQLSGNQAPIPSNRQITWEHFLDTLVTLGCEIAAYVALDWAKGWFHIDPEILYWPHRILRWFATATVGWFALDSLARIVWRSVVSLSKVFFTEREP